jgi:uncharacterized protein (TIGR00661 family)
MNILYGVVGEGMGHATRSEAVIRHLLGRGHKVVILASGKAEPYLRQAFAGADAAQVDAIRGTFMKYDGNRVAPVKTLLALLKSLPAAAVVNYTELKRLDAIHAIPDRAFDAVVSDFETLTHLYGRLKGLPIINIDNMSIITRCDHRALAIPGRYGLDRFLAETITNAKAPSADRYLITTFFYPPVLDRCREKTFLFPPILREEIFAVGAALRRGEIAVGEEILVYHTSATFAPLLDALDAAKVPCNVYGFDPATHAGRYRHLNLKARDRDVFFDDFSRARAVIAGGGFSLMSEAVFLGKPVFSLPLEGQFEQILNALYLEHLGYGLHVDGRSVTDDPAGFRARLDAFLEGLPRHTEALARYATGHPQSDNAAILAFLDECLEEAIR